MIKSKFFIDRPDCQIHWIPGWLESASAHALFAQLLDQVPWQSHCIQLFGRKVMTPRLCCWMGDAQAKYRYANTDFAPYPWHPALQPLQERLAALTATSFNSLLLNYYRHGQDSMAWHRDNEPELGRTPTIASLSLGASRRFLLRHRHQHWDKYVFSLGHGDVLVMAGATQTYFQHCVPKTARAIGGRINLTFRNVEPLVQFHEGKSLTCL